MPGQESTTGLARGTQGTAVQQLQRVGRGECMGPRVSCCEEHRPRERRGAGVQVGDDPTQVAVEQVVRQTWVLEVL